MTLEDGYFPVDLSRELLKITKKNLSTLIKKTVGCSMFFVSDVEAKYNLSKIVKLCKKSNPGPVVVAASGEGTLLSNPAILKNISRSLSKNDYLLVSIDGLTTINIKRVCRDYDASLSRDFLFHGVEAAKRSKAVKTSEGKFVPAFYNKKSKILSVQYTLNDGNRLILLNSFKPLRKNDLITYLKRCKLKPIKILKKSGAFGFLAKKF